MALVPVAGFLGSTLLLETSLGSAVGVVSAPSIALQELCKVSAGCVLLMLGLARLQSISLQQEVQVAMDIGIGLGHGNELKVAQLSILVLVGLADHASPCHQIDHTIRQWNLLVFHGLHHHTEHWIDPSLLAGGTGTCSGMLATKIAWSTEAALHYTFSQDWLSSSGKRRLLASVSPECTVSLSGTSGGSGKCVPCGHQELLDMRGILEGLLDQVEPAMLGGSQQQSRGMGNLRRRQRHITEGLRSIGARHLAGAHGQPGITKLEKGHFLR